MILMKKLLVLACLGALLVICFASCSCEGEDIILQQPVTVRFESLIGVDVPLQTVGMGMKITAPGVKLERAGYAFIGWYNGTKKWDFDKDTVTENITLTAKWDKYLSYVAVSEIESPTIKELFGEAQLGGVVVAGCDKIDTQHAVIPSTYNGKDVVGIVQSAFADNKKIKTVVIPSSVTVVAEGAFYGCVNLEKIYLEADTLPDGWSENIINTGAEIVLGYKK